MPSFKFSEYTEPELLACGDAFLASCRKIWDETDTTTWTEHVLDWFCATSPQGIFADARFPRTTGRHARQTMGEWIADLVHTSYPPRDDARYWESSMREDGDRAWSIHLALESEWGKARSHTATREMVLDDACKLTALHAAVKVLVTGAMTKHAADLEQDIRVLRTRTRDGAPWLWINLPNEDTPENCQYVMFGDRRGTVRGGPP